MTSRCTQGGLVSGFGASTAWSQTAQAVVSELGHGLCRADGMSQVGEVGGCGGYKTTRAREYTHTHTVAMESFGHLSGPQRESPTQSLCSFWDSTFPRDCPSLLSHSHFSLPQDT